MERLFSIACLLSVLALANTEIRIVGGNNANTKGFPYYAEIQIENNVHRCGGGIIGERFVLTAAHCVVEDILHETDENRRTGRRFENSQFKVVAGVTDLSDPKKYKTIEVEKIYVPNSYFGPMHKEDIAVLKLRQDIDLSKGFKKLQLPSNGNKYEGKTARIAGHGFIWMNNGRGSTDRKLKYLDVKIIANSHCKLENGVSSIALFDSTICGQAMQRRRGQIAGVCSGDSGSPLVIDNTVIGIASIGSTNCQENDQKHSLYTRVSSFLLFINNAMSDRKIDMRVHTIPDRDIIVFPEEKKRIKNLFL